MYLIWWYLIFAAHLTFFAWPFPWTSPYSASKIAPFQSQYYLAYLSLNLLYIEQERSQPWHRLVQFRFGPLDTLSASFENVWKDKGISSPVSPISRSCNYAIKWGINRNNCFARSRDCWSIIWHKVSYVFGQKKICKPFKNLNWKISMWLRMAK